MDRDRNQHSDPSGAPVDPRGPMSTQDLIMNTFLIVLECIDQKQIQSQQCTPYMRSDPARKDILARDYYSVGQS